MNKKELKSHVAKELGVSEDELMWSDKCRNPLTQKKCYETGTLIGSEGYYVLKN